MEINWTAASVLVAILVFGGGILTAVIGALLKANLAHIDRRFVSLERDIERRMGAIHALETELSEFRVHVAQAYVHREDFVRVEGAREVKLDRIWDKINELSATTRTP